MLPLYNKYFRKETITILPFNSELAELYNKYFRKETITFTGTMKRVAWIIQ